ncbi:hypothetical protein [Nocardioides cynanchi]|uniref:hypothetical protein n=1 Tax=Nocardioides cynanchi TaxID=2558918 RepID=UPI0012450927|nr:hypothetical protein [Nocardioides cynanchi]
MPEPRSLPLPPPLVVAASLAGLEGLLVLGYGVLEAASVHADRVAMGVTSAVFFVLLGGALVACAWLVTHGTAGARSPVIVVQVMVLGLAWDVRSSTWVAVGLAVVAAVVLVGLLHPASIAALAGDRPGERAGDRDHAP